MHYYEFETKAEMLSGGVLHQGDIIWCVDGSVGTCMSGLAIPASYHHIGIYMGSGSDDLWWQSGPTAADGELSSQRNSINPIYGCALQNTYVVIPFGADPADALFGDFNADGALSLADAVMLMRFLSEDDTLSAEQQSGIRQAVPDQDADGTVTVLDLTNLLNQLNKPEAAQ